MYCVSVSVRCICIVCIYLQARHVKLKRIRVFDLGMYFNESLVCIFNYVQKRKNVLT